MPGGQHQFKWLGVLRDVGKFQYFFHIGMIRVLQKQAILINTEKLFNSVKR